MNDTKIEILIKSWEIFQNLSKGFGENSWKIRTMGVGFWATVVAYGYKEDNVTMYYVAIGILLIFHLMECGTKIMQNKYIMKSIEIEKSINDILDDAFLKTPKNGISTNISNPNMKDFFSLYTYKRWMFWFPYLVLLILSISMQYIL